MSLVEKSAAELGKLMAAGEVSATEITSAFCDRIEAVEPKVKALLHFDRSQAIASAEAVDAKRKSGDKLGLLAGIPVIVKDVLCTRGQPTTCASKMLQNFVPPYDAHVVEKLRAADAVLIGRANMDEFAMGSSTENSAYQSTKNPWDLECVPGGSSGGSAAAVAALEAPLAVGTDTGGSIRQPASLCGVVGLKPTYGRVSRYGLVAFASSLDQIGPMARTAEDAALFLEAMAGHDCRDTTSVDQPVPAYSKTVNNPIEGLRVGVIPEHFGDGLDPEVAKAVQATIDQLKSQGAKVVEISMPNQKHAIAVYYLVATAEASSNLARYDGVHYGARTANFSGMIDMYSKTRGENFGPEVKRRIMLGTFALSAGYRDAYYIKALQVRRLIRQDYDEAFKQCDVLCGPVSPFPAFKVGEKADDPLAMYLSDIYTVSTNLAGIGAISVPGGFSTKGLPIGVQFQAAPFAEETLLRVAAMIQKGSDWHLKTPTL